MRFGYAFPVLILNFVSTLNLMMQWSEYLVRSDIEKYFIFLIITLCMKLSWFCHTNSGKPEETCCHSVVASKWLETRVSHFALQDENTTT